MLKVKNQKCISRLADKTFQANKTRNIIAVIAIALTTILFTALFTIGSGAVESFQYNTMLQAGGKCHATIKFASPSIYEGVKSHPLVKETGYRLITADSVDNPEFLKRRVEMYYEDETCMELSFISLKEGSIPQAENEIIMDVPSLDLLGVPARIGEKLTLLLTVKGQQVEREFVLSGYWEPVNPSMNVGFAICSKAYTLKYADELAYTHDAANVQDYSMTGSVMYDLMFTNSYGMKQKMQTLVEDLGYSLNDKDNNYISANVNWAYLSNSMGTDPLTIMTVAAALGLIILTGYLIIYNIFQISVIRDIRFYGLLKTIGTTGKQIKKIIRRQGMRLSLYGIPIGLVVGFFIGKAIVPFIMDISSFSGGEVSISLNPLIFVGAALFSLFTVAISTRKPGRMAAAISPVEAVKYTDTTADIRKKNKKSTDGGKIYKMALSNLGRNRKRTVLVIISLSLSAILMNSVVTLTESFDLNKYLSTFVDTDFLAAHALYFNNDYMSSDERISESLIRAIKEGPGFEEGGRILFYPGVSVKMPEPNPIHLNEYGAAVNAEGEWINVDENMYPRANLYGMEELPLARMEIVAGEKDPAVLKEKLDTGNYIIEGLETDDYGEVYEKHVKYSIGDKVTIHNSDGTEKEVEVIAQIKIKYYTNSVRYSSVDYVFYTSKDGYEKLGGDMDCVMTYVFQCEDDKEGEMEQFLASYTENREPMMSYESKTRYLDEFESLKGTFTLVGGVLSLIIGIIGVLNFVNACITSIITRKKEFAALKAIGMTEKQIQKMVCMEGGYYAAGVCFFSLTAGSIFSLAVMGNFVMFWFTTYRFILWPMLIVLPFMVLMGIIVPYITVRVTDRESVVEMLREE
nr:FtsX-like permease family protein [uncultured Eisenbergiella sp.]